jgi:hypothetical protein
VNSVYGEYLSSAFIITKIKKGVVGDQVEPIEVPHDCVNLAFLDELDTLDTLSDGVSQNMTDDGTSNA